MALLENNPEIEVALLLLLAASLTVLAGWSLWKRFRAPKDARGPLWRAVASTLLVIVAGFPTLMLGKHLTTELLPSRIAQNQLIDKPAFLDYRLVSDGGPKSLSDHRGSVVLVNIWATWCINCRAEMPELDRLQKDLKDRGLVVVTVSDEKRSKLEEFLEKSPLTTENAYVEARPWQTISQPTSFIIDRQGILREIVQGQRGYEYFVETVERYL